MSLWKALYYACAGCVFFTMVHVIFFARQHDWNRVTMGIPDGAIIGWIEFALFSFLGFLSFFFIMQEFKSGGSRLRLKK